MNVTCVLFLPQGSLDAQFIADLEFTAIVFLSHEEVLPMSLAWLRSSPDFDFRHIVCGDADDEPWDNVNALIQSVTSPLLDILKVATFYFDSLFIRPHPFVFCVADIPPEAAALRRQL